MSQVIVPYVNFDSSGGGLPSSSLSSVSNSFSSNDSISSIASAVGTCCNSSPISSSSSAANSGSVDVPPSTSGARGVNLRSSNVNAYRSDTEIILEEIYNQIRLDSQQYDELINSHNTTASSSPPAHHHHSSHSCSSSPYTQYSSTTSYPEYCSSPSYGNCSSTAAVTFTGSNCYYDSITGLTQTERGGSPREVVYHNMIDSFDSWSSSA